MALCGWRLYKDHRRPCGNNVREDHSRPCGNNVRDRQPNELFEELKLITAKDEGFSNGDCTLEPQTASRQEVWLNGRGRGPPLVTRGSGCMSWASSDKTYVQYVPKKNLLSPSAPHSAERGPSLILARHRILDARAARAPDRYVIYMEARAAAGAPVYAARA
ncbi:hypothetical protein EVAR_80363_1 [Eumeta japonica]|uniref:Uncharacterized protein n=1 Tax=Eumeta variegata TaxID=151549 RepID=A0A4C1X2L6_EUMVA|nr:hypothetical protein EVAR_80363_1 [Eumeta japonica]